MRPPRIRLLLATLGVLGLLAAGCGDDTDSGDGGGEETTAPVTEDSATTGFEGDLVGTFEIVAASCADADAAGSYFRMVQAGGTVADGPFIENADSSCADKSFTGLTPGSDGGLVTGGYQPSPDPAFDASGGALATAIFEPVPFFAVAFGGATDPDEAEPTLTATDGELSGDLSAFTAYYGGSDFNQGAPKPDGSGTPPTGRIDVVTGEFTLEWNSLISGGAFDGFTGVWHLEGTFVAG